MSNPNVRVELSADPAKLVRGFGSADAAALKTERALARVEKAERDVVRMQLQATRDMEGAFARRNRAAGDLSTAFGRLAITGGAVLAAGLALSARAAMQWESAWAGVQKVAAGSDAELAQLEGQLRRLATTMPATATEIAGVAEAAGQLGVLTPDIARFTETAIRLGVSTNLSAEDAATGLAKLGNEMGVATDQVDRAGAALVALGNDGASTEADILALAERIGAAGRVIGGSEAQVLGVANALSSLGLEAEAGGTAISKVFLGVNDAVTSGGKDLEEFASVAGVSVAQFRQSFAHDGIGAVTQFIAGLGRIQDEGGNVNGVLADLGLSESRVRDTLLRAAGASDKLTASIGKGTEAWQENIALVAESNRRFGTSESRIKVATNRMNEAAITIGEHVLPAFAALTEDAGTAAEMFSGLPGPVKEAAAALAFAGAAIGIIGGASAIAVPKIVALRTALGEMGPLGARAAAGMGRFGTVLAGPAGIGIAAGLAVATAVLGRWAHAQIEARQRVEALTDAIKADNGVVGENTALTTYNTLQKNGAIAAARELHLNVNDVTQAALGNAAAQERVNAAITTFTAAGIKAGIYVRGYTADIVKVRSAIGGQNEELNDAQKAWAEQQSVVKGAAAAAKQSTAATRDQARAQAILAGTGIDATEATKALKTALDNLNDPVLNLREAEIGWQKALDDVTASAKENGRSLDVSTEKGRANEQSMIDAARAAKERAQAILDSGGTEAEWRASLTKSRDSLEAVARKFITNKTKAKEYADQLLQIPRQVPTEVVLTGIAAAQQKIAGLAASIRRNASLQAGIYQSAGNVRETRQAGGGLIPGPPSTADTVPARLSTGEFVVQSAAVQKYGPGMLNAINARRFASGGLVGGYATGGMVTTTSAAALGQLFAAYSSSLGSAVDAGERADALRKRRDAIDALHVAELRLHQVQKDRHHTTLQVTRAEIADRKARESLTAASLALLAMDRRAAAQRQAPLSKLSAALSVGIRDGAAFVANVETLAARGFGELARQLAEQGDADAERMAADAVHAKPATVKALQARLLTATRVSAQRAQLGDIARVIDAMRSQPGGTLDDLAGALGLDVPTVVQVLQLIGSRLTGLPGGQHFAGLIPRAGGGRVEPGQAYLVGEQRAELFMPDQPGRIVPHVTVTRTGAGAAGAGAGAGGGDVFQIYAPTSSPRDLVATLQAERRRTKAVAVR